MGTVWLVVLCFVCRYLMGEGRIWGSEHVQGVTRETNNINIKRNKSSHLFLTQPSLILIEPITEQKGEIRMLIPDFVEVNVPDTPTTSLLWLRMVL